MPTAKIHREEKDELAHAKAFIDKSNEYIKTIPQTAPAHAAKKPKGFLASWLKKPKPAPKPKEGRLPLPKFMLNVTLEGQEIISGLNAVNQHNKKTMPEVEYIKHAQEIQKLVQQIEHLQNKVTSDSFIHPEHTNHHKNG